MFESNHSELFSVLTYTRDLARTNFLRASLNGFAALLVLFFIIASDRQLIWIPPGLSATIHANLDAAWVLKWMVAIGSTCYLLWAFGHAYISYGHLREVSYLWKRVNHEQ